ncbi:MAG: hypothetical protein N2507_03320 [Candidatus Bipolaricaulota bacterium]|nr:hypothetical protein [Candidatus Bipolaricaulota bacterium]
MVDLVIKSWGCWVKGRWAEVYWPRPEDLLRGLKEALELQGNFEGPSRWMAWRAEYSEGLARSTLTIYAMVLPYILVRFDADDETVEFLIPRDVAEEMVRILSQSLSESYERAAS